MPCLRFVFVARFPLLISCITAGDACLCTDRPPVHVGRAGCCLEVCAVWVFIVPHCAQQTCIAAKFIQFSQCLKPVIAKITRRAENIMKERYMVNKRIMTTKAMQSFPGLYPSKYYTSQYLQEKISYYCFLAHWCLPGALHFLFFFSHCHDSVATDKQMLTARGCWYCCRNTWRTLEPLWWVALPDAAPVLFPVERERWPVGSSTPAQSCRMQMCFATTSNCFFQTARLRRNRSDWDFHIGLS